MSRLTKPAQDAILPHKHARAGCDNVPPFR